MIDDRVLGAIADHPYPLLFATISGAHLYGFPSPDSDYDLRGAHILPLHEVVGLRELQDTVQSSSVRDRLEIDLVTHDVHKYFNLLLKRNGYVLEQVYSPLVIHSIPEYEALKRIVKGCITRHHVHHYLGFVKTQWRLFSKEQPRRVKPLLYVYRVLLTGIHLMRTGEVEANLVNLNILYQLPYVPDLIARKLSGHEQAILVDDDYAFHESEYQRLTKELELAHQSSTLPDKPSALDELNALLVQICLGQGDPRK